MYYGSFDLVVEGHTEEEVRAKLAALDDYLQGAPENIQIAIAGYEDTEKTWMDEE